MTIAATTAPPLMMMMMMTTMGHVRCAILTIVTVCFAVASGESGSSRGDWHWSWK